MIPDEAYDDMEARALRAEAALAEHTEGEYEKRFIALLGDHQKLRAGIEALANELKSYDGAVMSNDNYGDGFHAGLDYAAARLLSTSTD